jgi:hypothetical protein
MALGICFGSATFSADPYDAAIKQLDEAGASAPAGRQYHVAMQAGGNIQVFDIWDSQESFDAFGATLLPIMSRLGADPGPPMVAPVHNIIKG